MKAKRETNCSIVRLFDCWRLVRSTIAACVAAVGLAAVAAPSVTVNSVTENGTWSTIDVKYTLSDVDTTADYKVLFAVTADGVTKSVTNGTATLTSTSYTKTIDTKSLFGSAKRDAKAKVTVSLVEVTPDGVQLWANGPYFAECNVGATKPEESGYYFWWGDTVGYKLSGDELVSSQDDGSYINFSSTAEKANKTYKYGLISSTLQAGGWIDDSGNLVVSDDAATNHDAARKHLGAPWRMPTDAEMQMLTNTTYCATQWTKQNGVWGCKITGKGVYATKSIFLPAAGLGNGYHLSSAGEGGFYWSSTPLAPNSYYSGNACVFLIDSENGFEVSSYGAYLGCSVRPVRD